MRLTVEKPARVGTTMESPRRAAARTRLVRRHVRRALEVVRSLVLGMGLLYAAPASPGGHASWSVAVNVASDAATARVTMCAHVVPPMWDIVYASPEPRDVCVTVSVSLQR